MALVQRTPEPELQTKLMKRAAGISISLKNAGLPVPKAKLERKIALDFFRKMEVGGDSLSKAVVSFIGSSKSPIDDWEGIKKQLDCALKDFYDPRRIEDRLKMETYRRSELEKLGRMRDTVDLIFESILQCPEWGEFERALYEDSKLTSQLLRLGVKGIDIGPFGVICIPGDVKNRVGKVFRESKEHFEELRELAKVFQPKLKKILAEHGFEEIEDTMKRNLQGNDETLRKEAHRILPKYLYIDNFISYTDLLCG